MKLKILSLWQPHATLMVIPSKHNPEIPAKPVETRPWKTGFTGWLGIHSAMKKDPLFRSLCDDAVFKQYVPDFEKLPFGYIIGMVEINNCLQTDGLHMNSFIETVANEDQARMDEIREFGDFSEGRYGFTITDFVQFGAPIKARGAQGFWYYDMPNCIGDNILLQSSGNSGIILDFDDTRPLYKYLVKDDDETKHWYSELPLA